MWRGNYSGLVHVMQCRKELIRAFCFISLNCLACIVQCLSITEILFMVICTVHVWLVSVEMRRRFLYKHCISCYRESIEGMLDYLYAMIKSFSRCNLLVQHHDMSNYLSSLCSLEAMPLPKDSMYMVAA